MEKSEFISHNQTSADSPLSSFPDLPFVNPIAKPPFWVPPSVMLINSVNACLLKTNQLKLIGERLCHLQSHDAIILLRHSFASAIPKLLHILRTSPTFLSPTIQSFDNQINNKCPSSLTLQTSTSTVRNLLGYKPLSQWALVVLG